MKPLQCPKCQSDMDRIREPDIEIDKCPDCGGKFLDPGELNALVTAMAGDIEFCSLDNLDHFDGEDKHPWRNCPKPECLGHRMRKIDLLAYSDTIFDHCDKCGGFFLDQGELADTNLELEALTKHKSHDEYRGRIDGRLVRLDILADALLKSCAGGLPLPFVTGAVAADCLRLSVYFEKPLAANLHVSSEKWMGRFLKSIGLLNRQDIEIGHAEFDAAFIVKGDDPEKIRRIFSDAALRDELLQFRAKKFRMQTRPGTLEIMDRRIVYTEGPYAEGTRYDVEADPAGIVRWMVRLAALMES